MEETGCATRTGEITAEMWTRCMKLAPFAVCILDREYRFVWTNDEMRRILAASELDIEVLEAHIRRRSSIATPWLGKVLSTGEAQRAYDQVQFDDREVTVELTLVPLPDEADTVDKILAFVRPLDLTHPAMFETPADLLDNSRDVVAVVSADLEFERISSNVGRMLGYDPAELIATHALTLVHPDDIVLVLQMVRAAKEQTGMAVASRLRMLHADRSVRLVRTRTRFVDDRFIMHAREISDEADIEALRQTLSHADRLVSLGRLTASVAHEINNPAAFVTTNLHVQKELLDRLDELGARDPEVAAIAHDLRDITAANKRGLVRIADIVGSLRSFSRETPPRTAPVDLARVVEFARRVVAPRFQVPMQLEIDLPELPIMESDEGQIAQILVNLLANAADAVESSRDARIVRVTAGHDPAKVWIEVADNGPGVPEDQREQIFEPFFTTKSESRGNGLGLWLCREMSQRLGGEITLLDDDAPGARFRLTLPMRQPSASRVRNGSL